MDELRLASLLCARLCHDLVGPVGAINNGLELLAEQGPGPADDIVELLVGSGGEATRRLQYYRAAYAAGGGVRSLDATRRIAQTMFAGGKVALDWPENSASDLAEHAELSRLVLNMILCATEMLPRGGDVALRFSTDFGGVPRVTAAGPAIKITDAARLSLAASADDEVIGPRTIVFYLAARLAASLGGVVELTTPAPDTAELSMTLQSRA